MSSTPVATYSNSAVDPLFNAEDAMASMIAVKLKASTVFVSGTVLGEITASPGTYGPYASGHTDGTQIPAVILRRAVTTDSAGVLTNTDEWGANLPTAAVYTKGTFALQDLVGLDANAVTLLGGHIIEGAIGGNGVFSY